MATMAPAESAHPVTFDIAYPEQLNRWLILVKWLLAIPQLIIANLLGNVAQLLAFVAWFSILFTGK